MEPGDRTDIADAVWVGVDVAAEALGVTERQVRRIAKTAGWRMAPGTYPTQYLFNDIRTTYQARKCAGK